MRQQAPLQLRERRCAMQARTHQCDRRVERRAAILEHQHPISERDRLGAHGQAGGAFEGQGAWRVRVERSSTSASSALVSAGLRR